jgi:hypothetical protein
VCISAAILAGLLFVSGAQAAAPAAVAHPGLVRVATETAEARAEWDRRLARMVRTGALKVRDARPTPGAATRDEWLVQLHRGVPVVGGDVWRRLDGKALASAEGVIYEKIAINPVPKLTRDEARDAVIALTPGSVGPGRRPELMVLPTSDGKYVLVYRARVFDGTTLTIRYLDASTGAVVLSEEALPPPVAQ